MFQVRYTGYRDRPIHERQNKFLNAARDGSTEIVSETVTADRAATEVGIPTIGRYTDHFQLVGIFKIGVKMSQFGSKTAKKGVKMENFVQNYIKLGIFGTNLFKKG